MPVTWGELSGMISPQTPIKYADYGGLADDVWRERQMQEQASRESSQRAHENQIEAGRNSRADMRDQRAWAQLGIENDRYGHQLDEKKRSELEAGIRGLHEAMNSDPEDKHGEITYWKQHLNRLGAETSSPEEAQAMHQEGKRVAQQLQAQPPTPKPSDQLLMGQLGGLEQALKSRKIAPAVPPRDPDLLAQLSGRPVPPPAVTPGARAVGQQQNQLVTGLSPDDPLSKLAPPLEVHGANPPPSPRPPGAQSPPPLPQPSPQAAPAAPVPGQQPLGRPQGSPGSVTVSKGGQFLASERPGPGKSGEGDLAAGELEAYASNATDPRERHAAQVAAGIARGVGNQEGHVAGRAAGEKAFSELVKRRGPMGPGSLGGPGKGFGGTGMTKDEVAVSGKDATEYHFQINKAEQEFGVPKMAALDQSLASIEAAASTGSGTGQLAALSSTLKATGNTGAQSDRDLNRIMGSSGLWNEFKNVLNRAQSGELPPELMSNVGSMVKALRGVLTQKRELAAKAIEERVGSDIYILRDRQKAGKQAGAHFRSLGGTPAETSDDVLKGLE